MALFWDTQEAGYEHPTIENMDAFRDEMIQDLEAGITPIIEKSCYQNPSLTRNEEESQKEISPIKTQTTVTPELPQELPFSS